LIFEPNVISINKEGTKSENKEESFDNFFDIKFENKSTSEEKVEDKDESLFKIEFGNIELEPTNISFSENKEENLLNIDNLVLEKELENSNIEEIGIETKIEENIAKSFEDLNEGVQKYVEGDKKEENKEEKLEVIKAEEKKEIVAKPLTEFIQGAKKENKITGGEEIMVTNFNITISSEDIKKLAMEMVKDTLKNDNTVNTIIDHLQIDFQDEARRELEDIKNQLKSSLAKEAELMMKQEIERMIKAELKEYVTEITTKIVKEKLDAIFKG